MPKIDGLQLISGADIVMPELGLIMSQPKIKDIAYMFGEDGYYEVMAYLSTTKENLNLGEIPEEVYEKLTNYDCFMIAMKSSKKKLLLVKSLFYLLFPEYEVDLDTEAFLVKISKGEFTAVINSENFEVLLFYIKSIFMIPVEDPNKEKKQMSEKAQAIAKKIEEGKRKRQKGKESKGGLEKEISELAVYLKLAINDIVTKFTMYQLLSQIPLTKKNERYNQDYRAILAGAQGVELEYWRDNSK
ncbi:MAG: hypothetical protein ACRDCN_12855 [Tannerellaceae bacterium]